MKYGLNTILPPNLAKVVLGLMLCSLVFGNSYLSKRIGVTQLKGNELDEVIIENGLLDNNTNDNFFGQPAYAYSENLTVDGSVLSLDEYENISPSLENFFVIVDNSSFMNINSPLSFYLPTAKRHGILTYIVQEGDTTGKIASNFGVSLNTILWANNLKSGALIKPGQELVILPVSGVRHIVKQGDTVSSIAKKYQAVTQEIIAFNNLSSENSLIVGQELIIPNGQLSSSVSLAASTGLRPMTIDISSWPNETSFFVYPTSGGWNTGILHYYNAVDITNSCGSPIYASADGLIMEAKKGWNGGYGNYVKVQHFNGTLTIYAHLGEIYVKNGDRVNQGQTLGTMSDTGHATGCHLHFEVRGAQNPFVIKK